MAKKIIIGGELESAEVGGVVTGANAILDKTKNKKQNVINKETDDELARLESSKQDNLTFDSAPTEGSSNPVTSGGVYTADKALSDAIEAILLLIPSAATELNKLVDQNQMNSSISTATATFRGTYNVVTDLELTVDATHEQIVAKLAQVIATADNNDYCYVQVPVSATSTDIRRTERYKFNGTAWAYEYDLNTSGFTAAQWAAINSGITVALVTKLTDLPTAAALQLALNAKQDTLTFDTEPTALSQNPVTSGGIYLAIQAVATALSDYSFATDNRLNALEGLVPTEASLANQLADKAYVLAQILAATPAFKGQFVTLAELQAVASPKAGDLGIVRTKDSDGMDVFTVYQYLSNEWNVFFSLSYHPQTKPATTGTTGDYPFNGLGRVELAMNIQDVSGTDKNLLTQDMFYKGPVGSRVPNTNTIFVIKYDYELAEDITIPAGCALQFDGGSISGAYTITGNQTGIVASTEKIFDDITFAGTWNIQEAYLEWWGGKADSLSTAPTDNSDAWDAFVSSNMQASVKLLTGRYYFSRSIHLTSYKKIIGSGNNKTYIESDATDYAVFCDGYAMEMTDLFIQRKGYVHGTTPQTGVGFQGGLSVWVPGHEGTRLDPSSKQNTYSIYKNIIVKGFGIGFALDQTYLGMCDHLNASYCDLGMRFHSSMPSVSNVIIEQNNVGLESMYGGVSICFGVIEGNKLGCKLNGSRNNLHCVYFEGNLNPDVPYGSDAGLKDLTQGHIVCGTDKWVDSLTLEDCGQQYDNKIYVDKCRNFSAVGYTPLKSLTTTDNCTISHFDIKEPSVEGFDVEVGYNTPATKKSNQPIFNMERFDVAGVTPYDPTFQSNAAFYINKEPNKITSVGNYPMYLQEDGSIILARPDSFVPSTGSNRTFNFSFADLPINKLHDDIIIGMDCIIPNNIQGFGFVVRINNVLINNDAGGNTRQRTTTSIGQHLRSYLVIKKDVLDQYRASFSSISVQLYLDKSFDTFVSNNDDKTNNKFVLKRIFIYEGSSFEDNGINTYPYKTYENVADIFRVGKHLFLPQDEEVRYNAGEIALVRTANNELRLKGNNNQYYLPNGKASGTDLPHNVSSLPTASSTYEGCMVFNTTIKKMCYCDGTKWYSLDATEIV